MIGCRFFNTKGMTVVLTPTSNVLVPVSIIALQLSLESNTLLLASQLFCNIIAISKYLGANLMSL